MGPATISLAEYRARQAEEEARAPAPSPTRNEKSRQQSARSKEGQAWQALLESHLAMLASHRRLAWHRTSAPHRVVGHVDAGLVVVYTADGPPDYYITSGSVAIAGDAKATTQNTWSFSALEEHQAKDLDAIEEQGGRGCLFLLFAGESWVLPWRSLRHRWWSWFTTSSRSVNGTASLSAADVAELGWELDNAGKWLDRLKEA